MYPPVPIVLTILSFLLQSGLCSSSELETSRGGHIRIQHLTAAASSTSTGNCSTIGLGRHGGHGGLSCTSGSASGLMASAPEAGEMNQSRFPRLQSCAHFHYEFTDIGPISVIAPERLFSYNSRPKWQKFAKNSIENIRETNGVNLCLQQFDKF